MRHEKIARWLVPALFAAGAVAVTGAATMISWEQMASRRPFDLVVRTAGWLAITAGTVGWARQTRVRLAWLLMALGVALFLRDLRESDKPLVHTVGVCTAYGWTAIAAHLALAWPDGVLRGRVTAVLAAACYVCALGSQLMRVVDPGHTVAWARAGSASAGVLALVVALVAVRKWWTGRDHERSAELIIASIVIVGVIGAWVAFLNLSDRSNAHLDAVPVVVGLSVVPMAVLAYLRLRAQLLDVQASRQRAEQALHEVEQSRRRIVEAAMLERHRIQHDLHEGAQQKLASVQLLLSAAEHAIHTLPGVDLQAARGKVATARGQLTDAINELRAYVQGIYPAVLQEHGLLRALEDVAHQSPIPVVITVPAQRWAPRLEITAYFCAKEAIANALKYAEASRIDVTADNRGDALIIHIQDDGLGEALPPRDGGLRMLQDRVETFGGRISDFRSEPNSGTSITLHLPHPPTTPNTPTQEA